MKWLAPGLLGTYVVLWIVLRDPVGALITLIALAVAAALPLALGAYIFLNMPEWLRRFRGETSDAYFERLEKTGKATREHYETRRALTFEDHGTSCLVHVIEVGDGRLLWLSGQDYYDFEPIDDDQDMNQPREFPTITFSLLRHTSGDVLALFPGTIVVEPVVCKPIKSPRALHALGVQLKDGEFTRDLTLEAVENAVQRATRSSE